MKANDLVQYMAAVFPFRRKSSIDWIVPVSVGLGLGVAVGAGIGVLLTPTSGEETRRRLREGAGRLRESAGRLRESAGKVKERALGAAQRVQEQIDESTGGAAGGERSFANDLSAR